MSEYITEKNFLIAEGAEGDIYFFVEAKHQHPSAPKIIYDGRDHAVFIRNPEQKIIWITSIPRCGISSVRPKKLLWWRHCWITSKKAIMSI